MTILVISDDLNTRHELIGKAKTLDPDVVCLAVGACECDPPGQGAFGAGASKVLLATPPVEEYSLEGYVAAAAAAVNEVNPDAVLIGSTKDGKEFAAALSAKLDKPLAADCIDLRMEGGNLEIDRIMYGGNAVSTQAFSVKPALVTIAPKTFDKPEGGAGSGEVAELSYEAPAAKVTIAGVTEKQTEAVDLASAVIIVSCGRGMKNKEDIEMINGLAKALNAEVGCSRPIASDLKWMTVDHWVGLSGKKVKPTLYLAIGISGQIQHLAGMRDSKMIVAINKDADAPIFQAADYGIVGDLYKVVGELTTKLQ